MAFMHYGLALTDFLEIIMTDHIAPHITAAIQPHYDLSLTRVSSTAVEFYSEAEYNAFYENVRAFNTYVSEILPIRYVRAAIASQLGAIILEVFTTIAFILIFLRLFIIGLCVSGSSNLLRALLLIFFAPENGVFSNGLFATLFALFAGTLLFNISAAIIYPGASLVTSISVFVGAVLVALVVAIPFLLIGNWGAYTTAYIKGQSTSANIVSEMLTDVVHLISFFLRINIQLIRVVIIAGTSYTLYELYYEGSSDAVLDLTDALNNATLFDLPFTLNAIIGATFHLLFELGHF